MNAKELNLNEYCSFGTIERIERVKRKGAFRLPTGIKDLPIGVWVWYGLEKRLFFSESLLRMIGIPDEMVPTLEGVVDCICLEDQGKFIDILEGLLDGVRPESFSFRVMTMNGVKKIECCVGVMRTEMEGMVDVVGVCY